VNWSTGTAFEPNVTGIAPSYEERHFPAAAKRGRLCLIAAPDGRDGAVTIHQDARLYAGLFDGAESARHEAAPGRKTYLHVVRGRIEVDGERLLAGDAAMTAGAGVQLARGEAAEVLLFDLP